MKKRYSAIDLFSGAGGMSYGFHINPKFDLFAAFDAEKGKPSGGDRLDCNSTYQANMGFSPYKVDLGQIEADEFANKVGRPVDVFIACPPCTGFSRANPNNHIVDDSRNNLVVRSAELALSVNPKVILMENARELIQGNFSHHYREFRKTLESNGYCVYGNNYFLNSFGLPQIRERSIIIAARNDFDLHTLDELWEGYTLEAEATTVRRTIGKLDSGLSEMVSPSFASKEVEQRMKAIPKDGGSWIDLLNDPRGHALLTGSMKRTLDNGRIGSYPDVYGRMAWDKPAPTIKRECSHVGNGRYAHPEENRLCSVREMALLQGFPSDFKFGNTALSNKYRHIGDAVPPLISYQLSCIADWILTGEKPILEDCILQKTNLKVSDVAYEGNYVKAG